jgi:hypothetical protein
MPAGRLLGGLRRAASDRQTLQPRGDRDRESARPDRHGQGACRQREGDPPPLLRPREPPPLDAGRAQAARQVGPASLICARCAALQPPCAARARVLRLLRGRRRRLKNRVLIVWVLDLSVRRPGAQIFGFSVCVLTLWA